MASINTNAAAMTALQTLTATNKNLSTTQDRIATGLRVGQAADNAAYWSIATTMRSDNRSMSSVQDALGFGAAQVDVAYTAMDAVKETLDNMKSKLVAASQPDIDKAKIQEEINQLQNDLKTYAESASFSGGNWLNVSENKEQKVVAAFMRDAGNNISLGTISIDTAKTALFNADTDAPGLLQKGAALDDIGGLVDVTVNAAAPSTEATTTPAYTALTLEEGNTIRFELALNGGEARTVTIDKATVDAALDSDDGVIANEAAWALVLEEAFTNAGFEVDPAGDLTISATGVITTVEDDETASIAITGMRSSENGIFFNATELNITTADADLLTEYMQGIDKMLLNVTTAASDLGAIKTRIDSQQTFVGKIMDAIDRGVGQLVDADMQEESARLSALQVQQQLGIQALSIANSNAQNILSLFR